MAKALASGVVHAMPVALREELLAHPKSHAAWESLTPLSRNEFICWVEDAKKLETRVRRIARTWKEITEGRRRPCCWIGCTHRSSKAISLSVRAIVLRRRSTSR